VVCSGPTRDARAGGGRRSFGELAGRRRGKGVGLVGFGEQALAGDDMCHLRFRDTPVAP